MPIVAEFREGLAVEVIPLRHGEAPTVCVRSSTAPGVGVLEYVKWRAFYAGTCYKAAARLVFLRRMAWEDPSSRGWVRRVAKTLPSRG